MAAGWWLVVGGWWLVVGGGWLVVSLRRDPGGSSSLPKPGIASFGEEAVKRSLHSHRRCGRVVLLHCFVIRQLHGVEARQTTKEVGIHIAHLTRGRDACPL